MAFDNGYPFAAQTLPTPTDTPYDSPSMGISRQSSRQGSSSPSSNYSSVPFPPSEDSYFLKQGTTDDGNVDGTSAHESRRFTSNHLGISLVTQIHSLRKEMGSKNSMIENLEEGLHKSRAANQQLAEDLKTEKVEVISVRNQMQALESDMLRALEDMAKERDNAIESVADTRKRLEDSKYKVRAKEEEANKTHALWEKDRQNWDDKRRRLEGRVHVVEERLKTMVTEMLVVQNTDQQNSGMGHEMYDEMKDTWVGKGNDTSNVRAITHLSNRSLDGSCESNGIPNFISSRMSGLHGLGGSQMSGLSLAQELELDEGEDVAEEEDDNQDALPEGTITSARRYSENEKAKKVIGFHANTNEELPGDESSGQHSIGIINDYIEFPRQQLNINYTDTGTQVSPPPSPSLQTQSMQTHTEQTERAANQSRKRTAIPQTFVEQTPALKGAEPKTLSMDFSGDQKIRRLEDPGLIAKAGNETHISVLSIANEMKSVATQTFEEPIQVSKSASFRLSPSPIGVPVIAIHPPASRPSSSRNSVMLPPRTKNAACQVDIELPKNTKSTSMQTEDTKIDKPASTQTLPRLAERRKQSRNTIDAEPSRRGLRSPPLVGAVGTQPSRATARVKNAYAGVNDNGPLNPKQRSAPRRPVRSESLFAGFYVSSDEDIATAQDHFSDDEFLNAAPLRKTLSKVQNSWKLVPQLKDSVLERLESASEEAEDEQHMSVPEAASKAKASAQTKSKTFQTRPMEGYRIAPNNNKQPDMRRKALISNGIAEHAQWGSESNVLGNEATVAPPFPVPIRSSSRIVSLSASDGGDGPGPHTTTFFNTHNGQSYDTPLTKRKMLRKVQSAAAVIQPPPLRPQPTHSLSASSTMPPSPRSPAPRRNQFILPYSVANLPNHTAPPQPRAGVTSVETLDEKTSVVDTIAQTMVGEWMWKYVRKRISFGLTENPQAEFESGRNGDNGNSHGVRHKRWVWLAPSERAVIWSSKQPTSGPALLGKGGRKLLIQSVLDVKDDTPLPKNAVSQALFDRSILILTPQRALKFTATSRERHYVWLAALSYISSTTRGMDDLASPPPLPTQEYHCIPSQESMTGFDRTPLEDSIRTAKVKARPSIGRHSYSSPIGAVEEDIIEGARSPWGDEEAESHDAAEPPQVHRFATHARKRSSTGPRAVPPNAFNSYAINALAVTSSCSLQGATWRERYDTYTPQPQAGPGANTRPSTLTRGMTEGSIVASPVVPDNFYEGGGTVRMEAFVKSQEKEYVVSTRGKSYRTRQGRKKDMSFWGLGFDASATGSGLGSARLPGEDPFTGF